MKSLYDKCKVAVTIVAVLLNSIFIFSLQKCSFKSTEIQQRIVPTSELLGKFNDHDEARELDGGEKLAFVSVPYFHACADNYERVTCQTTILFDSNAVLPLSNISDSKQQESVCLQIGARVTPFVQVPVCVQSADGFGVLVYTLPSANVVAVVQSLQEKWVKDLIETYVPNMARIVELKKVDFPAYYRRTENLNNSVTELFRDSNYGNMVWRYAATTILNPVTTQFDRSDQPNNLSLRDGPVHVHVLATANALGITQKLSLKQLVERFTRRIIARNVSTIVLGVGVQMEFDDSLLTAGEDTIQDILFNTNVSLPHKFQVDFLEEASKRQSIPSIGVRGDLTRKVCENSGIHNCVSMGCPSLTISREMNLGKKLQKNWVNILKRVKRQDKALKIAVTSPAYASVGKFVNLCRIAMAYILDEFSDHATMIEQTPYDWNELMKFNAYNWTNVSPKSIAHVEFFNVESWLASAQEFDLCISFRIHGSTMFFNAGVPTVLIPTDFRIMELISAMKVPYLVPHTLQTAMDANSSHFRQPAPGSGFSFLESLLKMAKNTNFTEFELNRREKISGWKNILNSVDLEMDPALSRVIDSPLEME
jgi:Polysaccharide pyruvyl transferase